MRPHTLHTALPAQRPVVNEVHLEKQVGVPRESIKYVDNVIEQETVREVPVYIEKEVIKYEDRVIYQDVSLQRERESERERERFLVVSLTMAATHRACMHAVTVDMLSCLHRVSIDACRAR